MSMAGIAAKSAVFAGAALALTGAGVIGGAVISSIFNQASAPALGSLALQSTGALVGGGLGLFAGAAGALTSKWFNFHHDAATMLGLALAGATGISGAVGGWKTAGWILPDEKAPQVQHQPAGAALPSAMKALP